MTPPTSPRFPSARAQCGALGSLLAISLTLSACAPARRLETSTSPAGTLPAHVRGFTDDGNSVPVRPGPALGQRLPTVHLQDADGRDVTLQSLYRLGPIVVVFYRGGWCPSCTGSLKEWEGRYEQLEAMGVRFVAITPEKPAYSAQTADRNGLDFEIFSDDRFEAADAFRLRFSLDEATREKYRAHGVDLADRNARPAWDLPAPGTFIVDVNGVVRYAFADWDYTRRADPDEVIAAAQEVMRPGPTRTR